MGHDSGGQLTEAVRQRPSVILLDEVEKAHPEIFNTLLQVLDDGRLTDGRGRTVDFRNCLIIMTSNLGTSMGDQSTPEIALEAVRSHFRPEFLNRIDEIVIFQSLTKSNVQRILELQLGDLADRLAIIG